MKEDAIVWEEMRLQGLKDLEDYPWFKERHRIFPAVFEDRDHKKILDISAGVGCAAKRIHDNYSTDILCNDISPTCLRILQSLGLPTTSFDIDVPERPYPFPDGHFDAVISLVTIEHLIHVDHHLKEIHRILAQDGYLYISTPNYAAPEYVIPMLLTAKAYHDPLSEESKYEFYAHVRYFTYQTLLELAVSFGFAAEAVYLALPGGSSRYRQIYAASRARALAFRYARWLQLTLVPARWAIEPVLCLQKTNSKAKRKVRKVVL